MKDFLTLIQPESAFEPYKPGFFRIPEKTYRAAPGESQTALKPLLQSGKHYQYHKEHPFKGTDYSRFGTLVHGIFLQAWLDPATPYSPDFLTACEELMKDEETVSQAEPSAEEETAALAVPDAGMGMALNMRLLGYPFDAAYAVIPSTIKRTTKAGKAAYAELCAANTGKPILKAKTAERLEKWVIAVTEVMKELKGDKELTYLMEQCPEECRELAWFCEIEGVWCKGLLDAVPLLERLCIVDLKATVDASLEGWKRKVLDMDYEVQAALYCKAVQILTGVTYPIPWAWIVVESGGPWCHNLISPPDELLNLGWEKCVRALELLKRCRAANEWPGYEPGLKLLPLKPWDLKRDWQAVEST